MREFRVYFSDGNQKLYMAPHVVAVIHHISDDLTYKYGVTDIVKIEEITNEDDEVELLDIIKK